MAFKVNIGAKGPRRVAACLQRLRRVVSCTSGQLRDACLCILMKGFNTDNNERGWGHQADIVQNLCVPKLYLLSTHDFNLFYKLPAASTV